MTGTPTDLSPAAAHRVRSAAQQLCSAVELRMDELIQLVEYETALVRQGKLFALKDLEPHKARATKEYISGLDAVRKIRASLEQHCPDTIYRLRRRQSEFRSMLQLSLAALATARQASDELLDAISNGQGIEPDAKPGAYRRVA